MKSNFGQTVKFKKEMRITFTDIYTLVHNICVLTFDDLFHTLYDLNLKLLKPLFS